MKKAHALLPVVSFASSSRKKRSKRRCREITTARRKKTRLAPYRDVIKVTEEIEDKAREAAERLCAAGFQVPVAQRLFKQIEHHIALADRVFDR